MVLFIRPTLSEGRQRLNYCPPEGFFPFHSSAAQKRRNDSPHTSLVIIHEFFFSVRSRCTFFKLAKRFWRSRVVPLPLSPLSLHPLHEARWRWICSASGKDLLQYLDFGILERDFDSFMARISVTKRDRESGLFCNKILVGIL